MQREKSLMVNTILYFLGSMGKGISSILIVFIASYFIDPSSIGMYDLIISTIALLQPIIIFQINDGIYRWILDSNSNTDEIIQYGFQLTARNLLVVNLIFVPLALFFNIEYRFSVLLLLNINCIYPILQQITRGFKNHLLFAKSGILNSVLVIVLSTISITQLQSGIAGLYLSQFLANTVTISYLFYKQRNVIKLSFKNKLSLKTKREMISYSIMLVPNSINQWIIKALDKYFILAFLTTYDNGIFSVAHRFPEILIMLNTMFYSAWVEQSIVEYKSKDRDQYFSKIFNTFTNVVFSVVLVVIPLTKYGMGLVVGSEFQESWKYVSFLYLGVAFWAFSTFFGTGYLSTKKTSGIMKTSLIGSAVSILINVIFMPFFGLQVAGISSFFAYFTMWLFRVVEMRKYLKIEIHWFKFIAFFFCALSYTVTVNYSTLEMDVLLEIFAICIALISNRTMIKSSLREVRKAVLKFVS